MEFVWKEASPYPRDTLKCFFVFFFFLRADFAHFQ